MTDPAVHHHHQDQRRDVRQWLTQLPDLAATLALFRAAGSTPVDPDQHSGKPSNPSRPPINLAVLDLMDTRQKDADRRRTDYDLDRMAGSRRRGILPVLSSWVLSVDEDLENTEGYVSPWVRDACCGACFVAFVGTSDLVGCCVGAFREHPWGDRTVAGECAYLLTHLDWCAEQQWFSEMHDDLKGIRRDVRQAIGDRDPLPLRCTVLDCGWPVEGMDGGSWYRCTGCQKNWSRLELHRLVERQRPMKLSEVARVLDTPLGTLKRWEHEKRIHPKLVLDGVKHYSLALCEKAKDRVEKPGRRQGGRNQERIVS